MLRICAPIFFLLVCLINAPKAIASSDYGCTPQWKLLGGTCDNMVMLTPGNDTRVNLMLLMFDKRGTRASFSGPFTSFYGTAREGPRPQFVWPLFRDTLYAPKPESDGTDQFYSRCKTNGSGILAFEKAVNDSRKLTAVERTALVEARRAVQPDCESVKTGPVPGTASLSGEGKDFALYVEGAGAFYDGDYDTAAARFAALQNAANPWVRETAAYMVGRVEINRALAGALDEWGGFAGPEKVAAKNVMAAEAGLLGYLRAWPKGRYAGSASGLLRRAYWLGGQQTKLAGQYQTLLSAPGNGIDDIALIEEIDSKLITNLKPEQPSDPVFLATIDLMAMRQGEDESGAAMESHFAAADLEKQRPAFATALPLFDYLRALHAFSIGKHPADVLTIIPDAAKQKQFTYLDYSRQMLRGMALDATKDRNTRGFWIEMMAGATQPYQREGVELALALHEERSGALARIFEAGSSIHSPAIRELLLLNSAGPALLRQQADNPAAARHERDTALFTLLYKQLTRGSYAGFASDVDRVRAGAGGDANFIGAINGDMVENSLALAVPLDLFKAAPRTGGYACPVIKATAAKLATAPKSADGQLCLADFLRLNSFDHFVLDTARDKAVLGGAPSPFPGKVFTRQAAYQAIIADTAVSAADKSYALYRAVNCYAPSGNNDCGGTDVEKNQRRDWFVRLKKDYPQSRWAQALKLYW